ncbi:MAG: HesA/MoeB/ThiF family protein [Candidatus Thermoplasmatota archaeon]|nr:HesA/MoeB/ThiF family protein [Candidatus Thermoplasmatota archaeon]
MLTESRYSRQVLLPEIGPQGQKKLAKARAVVIGCGALGTHTLSLLVRAGVGNVTVVDRDVVELTNLQRQTLFQEDDVGKPKAEAAQERLQKVNSEVAVKGIVAEVDAANVERLVGGATVVVDATDNMETRYIVNDACVRLAIPWVYGGAVGVSGMVMVVTRDGPCLRCVFPSPPRPGDLPTCNTVGIVNTLPSAVSSMQVTEAFKLIMGKEHTRELMVLDVWSQDIQKIKVVKDPKCAACGRGGRGGSPKAPR